MFQKVYFEFCSNKNPFKLFLQPKRKIYEDFWEEFEGECAAFGLVSTIPACMKRILTVSGYNSALSFKSIDESKVQELELYIEANHRKTADEFPEYAEIKPFQFLPGHRSLILGIKDEILNIQTEKKQKFTKKSRRDEDEPRDEQSLELSLRNQMSAYANGIGLNLDWTQSINNIVLTSTGRSTMAQCSVSCPVCNKDYMLRYDRNWKVTNMYRHIRSHITTVNITNEDTTDLNTNVEWIDDYASDFVTEEIV